MTFSQVSRRLRAIKDEIRDLKLLPIVDIQEKIQVLRNINTLLKEQNRLLCVRQEFLEAGYMKENMMFPRHIREEKVVATSLLKAYG